MPDPHLVSSATVYPGRLFDVTRDTIEMENGITVQREIIRHPGAVCMVPVLPDGNVLFVTQYRHAAGRRLLELPAGTLEPDEDPQAAAIRELQEEVGYRPGRVEALGGFFVAPGYTSEYIHLFICTELSESSLAADDDEDIEIEVLTPDMALAAIESGAIDDAKSIIGILRWQRSIESRNR